MRGTNFTVVFGKPALDFSQRMAVFLWMLILIAEPRFVSRQVLQLPDQRRTGSTD